MTRKLVCHAVADLFPQMSADEFAALKDDIKTNGQREAIWLHAGRIVDGRHRYRACCELSIEPKTRDWDGKGSLTAFVVSLNLHRRSLTSSQKGAIAADASELFEAEAKERQKQSAGRPKTSAEKGSQKVDYLKDANAGKATQQAAKAIGTNRQYVQDAKAIKTKAPELHEKVKLGELKITQAKNELRKREKTAELEQKAKEVAFESDQPMWTLINQDVMDGMQSVMDHHSRPRLIFTDPPYNVGVDYGNGSKADKLPHAEYLAWAADWINYSHELLSPDGSLWVMINDEYAAEYAMYIKRVGFTIRAWIKWYETFGVNCANNFNRTSRHIFYAVKNPKAFVFNESAVSRPSDRQTKYGDKRASPGGKIWDDVWQIPRLTGTCKERISNFPTQLPLELVEAIVCCASDPGDLVVDPFNGSGTTGEACIKHGRKYIGIDKSEEYVNIANKRLKTTMPFTMREHSRAV